VIRRKKAERKEKPEPKRFAVVSVRDARVPKYLVPANEDADGFTPEQAARLAERVPGQREIYTTVPIEVFRFARAMGEPISPPMAVAAYELYLQAEKDKLEEGGEDG
jgi:hypothetical protein